jgi:hypothetical protein
MQRLLRFFRGALVLVGFGLLLCLDASGAYVAQMARRSIASPARWKSEVA